MLRNQATGSRRNKEEIKIKQHQYAAPNLHESVRLMSTTSPKPLEPDLSDSRGFILNTLP